MKQETKFTYNTRENKEKRSVSRFKTKIQLCVVSTCCLISIYGNVLVLNVGDGLCLGQSIDMGALYLKNGGKWST